jgi:hypothetical protein
MGKVRIGSRKQEGCSGRWSADIVLQPQGEHDPTYTNARLQCERDDMWLEGSEG